MRIPRGLTMLKWLFCFVTAVIVAFVTILMGVLIAIAFKTREAFVQLVHDKGEGRDVWGICVIFFGIYGVFNLICAALGAATVLIGSRQAAGSGIPELVAFLNGVEVPQFLTWKTFIMKVIGATLTVAASLPVGYQGVLLHIGGMLACLLSKSLPHFELSPGPKRQPGPDTDVEHRMATVNSTADLGIYSSDAELPVSRVTVPYLEGIPDPDDVPGVTTCLLPEDRQNVASEAMHRQSSLSQASQRVDRAGKRPYFCPALHSPDPATPPQRVHFLSSTAVADLVACGAAAGVSAAFKAPVGGMLYLMELSTRWRLELTWRTFFSTSITAVVLRMLLTGCEHSRFCGFIIPTGSKKYAFSTPYEQLPVMGVFSVLMGLLGALFVWLNAKLVKLRRNWSNSKVLLFIEVLLLSMATTGAYLMLTTMGTCKACDEDAPSACFPGAAANALAHIFCPPGYYNDLATLVVSPTGDVIHTFWSIRYDDFATRSLALFIPVYFLLAAWTSGAAIPSGSFSPTILLGSAIGRLFAHVLEAIGIVKRPDAALYSLLGAAGFFTGQTRMTVGLCVILLEMTEVVTVLPFVMLVVIIAKGTADRMGDSTILRRIKLKNLPYLARLPHLSIRRHAVTADDVCQIRDHPVLPKDAAIDLVRQTLARSPNQQVFVIADSIDSSGFGVRSYDPSESAADVFERSTRPCSRANSRSGGPQGSPRSMISDITDASASNNSVVFLGVVSRSVLLSHLAKHEARLLREALQREAQDAANNDDTTADLEWPCSVAGSAVTAYGSINIQNLNQNCYAASESSMAEPYPFPLVADAYRSARPSDVQRAQHLDGADASNDARETAYVNGLDLSGCDAGSWSSTPTKLAALWNEHHGHSPLSKYMRARRHPGPSNATQLSGFPEVDLAAQLRATPISGHNVDGAEFSFGGGFGPGRAPLGRTPSGDEQQVDGDPYVPARMCAHGFEYYGLPDAEVEALWQSKIDLTPVIQVAPITIAPNMSLEAIFHLMNNMGLELLPVVAPGGVYHGLITRRSVIRYQRKLDQREEFNVMGARHLLVQRLNLKSLVRRPDM